MVSDTTVQSDQVAHQNTISQGEVAAKDPIHAEKGSTRAEENGTTRTKGEVAPNLSETKGKVASESKQNQAPVTRLDSATLDIHFHCAYSTYDPKLDDNQKKLDEFVERIQKCLQDSTCRIKSIEIVGSASPEGRVPFNKRLSINRAARVKSLIVQRVPSVDSLITTKAIGVDWEGLELYLRTHEEVAHREQMLDIITTTPEVIRGKDGKLWETRKLKLAYMNGGKDWKYILNTIFPSLRRGSVMARLVIERYPVPTVIGIEPAKAETQSILPLKMPKAPEIEFQKKVIAAVKTNLLYDAVTAVNYSVEVPFSIAKQDFSLVYDCYFPWWLSRDNRRCLEYLALGGEARWWFSSDATLQGSYVGAYAFSGKSDLQKDNIGCYQFEFFSAGLSYGYSMPLCDWLNLEFSISLGYARVPYRHYNPTDDWQILIIDHSKEGVMQYFGPTRAAITLSVPLTIKYRKR